LYERFQELPKVDLFGYQFHTHLPESYQSFHEGLSQDFLQHFELPRNFHNHLHLIVASQFRVIVEDHELLLPDESAGRKLRIQSYPYYT
jgi:hypothetical protein